ncbi:hypothetical protein [Mycobacterium tilburgii]|uniref:hypothetical protein n=1 Tax=Mycobacterium tilburgii TaxID=44467 RepID=UPI003898DFD6
MLAALGACTSITVRMMRTGRDGRWRIYESRCGTHGFTRSTASTTRPRRAGSIASSGTSN